MFIKMEENRSNPKGLYKWKKEVLKGKFYELKHIKRRRGKEERERERDSERKRTFRDLHTL